VLEYQTFSKPAGLATLRFHPKVFSFMPLAIFDLDETLIAADSDHEWGRFLVDRGLVDADQHKKKNDAFYADYKAGQLDIDEYLAFACSVLTMYSMQELHAHRADFVAERIQPLVLKKALARVAQHRADGDELLVITSTIEFITRPIVDLFGIETLIAPNPEIRDNRYTGKIVGTPSFGAGKVTRLQQWLAARSNTTTDSLSGNQGVDNISPSNPLSGSYFYSDSHNDLPLLAIVDHPIAVDPDPTLRREAEAKKWQIVSLRD
jgi:HAD superfamily hydrolase (TIGR01490 family)